ncbi:uncharacterized protein NPIL_646901 [Nephila pilipes]|uniref:Uncharacterized protein n=1 Tax=Nephila pilipes TaxID=299642 RepID=A0A8X6TGA9_NEPPI|nr:uncharacterized protein NPIL_646901 [Nephila pilipes]
MSLAYAECPLDIRESLAAQYFVDVIRDEDTQHSTRLIDAKDFKSALSYKECHSKEPECDLLAVQQKRAFTDGLPSDQAKSGKTKPRLSWGEGCIFQKISCRRIKNFRTEGKEKWTILRRIDLWCPMFDVSGYRCERNSFKNRHSEST